ncbi:MAG: response regulator [Acetobacteraceae bacterium]
MGSYAATAGIGFLGAPSVLVVEDEWLLRNTVADYLRELDFVVAEADSADDALTRLQNGLSVDLIISDVKMPGRMDGIGLAGWLEANRPSLPVILASGTISLTDAHRPSNVWRYLEKPYNFQLLEEAVLELFALRRASNVPTQPEHAGACSEWQCYAKARA